MVRGNLIGTNALGAEDLGNRIGVWITGGLDNQIGGTTVGAGNQIAWNTVTGIEIDDAGTGNAVQGNSISHNNSLGSSIGESVVFNGQLYFTAAFDSIFGRRLWKSDGTEGGTVRVDSSFIAANTTSLTVSDGKLYFSAFNSSSGTELWRADETNPFGVVLVKDIVSGTTSSSPVKLTDVAGTLFFFVTNVSAETELWTSDGTSGGTQLVKNLGGAPASGIDEVLAIGSSLYFRFGDGTSGTEVWKSDGTTAGTGVLIDIAPGNLNSTPRALTNVGGTLYFAADDGSSGLEIWKSNGTEAGTVRVTDLNPGSNSGVNESAGGGAQLQAFNGELYFSGYDGSSFGTELWKTNGTEAGTVRVKDINNTGTESSLPR